MQNNAGPSDGRPSNKDNPNSTGGYLSKQPQYASKKKNKSPLAIIIKFSSNSPDSRVDVDDVGGKTISWLKSEIRSGMDTATARRRMRLIYLGRVLLDSSPLSSLQPPTPPSQSTTSTNLTTTTTTTTSSSSTTTTTAAAAAAVMRGSNTSIMGMGGFTPSEHPENVVSRKGKERSNPPVPVVYIHASLGDELTAEQLANEKMRADAEEIKSGQVPSVAPAARGFDRLREMGFTDGEVASLRDQFQRAHMRDEDDEETLRLLEERWIDEGETTTTVMGWNGTYEEMMVGVCIGFFTGILSVWILWEGSSGAWGISKRCQLAIVAGLLVNISFACLKILQ